MTADAQLAAGIEALVWAAGEVVLQAHRDGLAARAKADGSPVTDADLRSQALLVEGMRRLLPGVPIVAEEGDLAAPAPGDTVVLIDPLDGTREFVDGRPEFTINVAIVRHGRPAIGVMLAPALPRLFAAWGPGTAVERRAPGGAARPLRPRAPGGRLAVLVSRSHLDGDTRALVAALGDADTVAIGSALKLGMVAAGEADLYPRLAPTRSWDIAAGECIVACAGGVVMTPAGEALRHDAASGYRNAGFLAAANHEVAARARTALAR